MNGYEIPKIGGFEERTGRCSDQTISILIVDDHAIVREGLRAVLSLLPGVKVIGEADNGVDAIHKAVALGPRLIIMDLSMPGMNGTEAIREIRRRDNNVIILVMTMHSADQYINASMRAGANGYVLKDATLDELVRAIETSVRGESYFSKNIYRNIIFKGVVKNHKGVGSPLDVLTHRERVVLKLIAEGRQNKSIANCLCISVKTVEKHRSNLMKKLDLHNAAAVTAFAMERTFISGGM